MVGSVEHHPGQQGRQHSHRVAVPRNPSFGALSCKRVVSLMGDYLSTDLDRRGSHRFEAHLKSCPDCLAFHRTYRKTVMMTRAFLRLQRRARRPLRLCVKTPS